VSISDFESAAQIAMPQLATPAAPGTLVSTLVSAARQGAKPFRHLGLAMRFKVDVTGLGEGLSLGHWTSCEGLKVEFKFEPVRSGGDYGTTHLLPQYVSYPPVTLKRAVEKPYSDAVRAWLREVEAEWRGGGDLSSIAKTVTIYLLDVYLNVEEPAAAWVLANAVPVAWSGPSMSAKSNEIASETLVLEHDGFLQEPPE
jgi:phage tail-like protein